MNYFETQCSVESRLNCVGVHDRSCRGRFAKFHLRHCLRWVPVEETSEFPVRAPVMTHGATIKSKFFIGSASFLSYFSDRVVGSLLRSFRSPAVVRLRQTRVSRARPYSVAPTVLCRSTPVQFGIQCWDRIRWRHYEGHRIIRAIGKCFVWLESPIRECLRTNGRGFSDLNKSRNLLSPQ